MIAAATAARAAGMVVVGGILLNIVDAPITAVVGGLALITYGRSLTLDRSHGMQSATALAVIAIAVGVSALRWGTLELEGIRGAQAALGPSVVVGPEVLAGACIAAGLGGIVAVSVWLAEGRAEWLGYLEGTLAALVLVEVFAVPGLRGVHLGDLALVVGATGLAAGVAVALSSLVRRSPAVAGWIALFVAGTSAAASAAVVVT